MAITSYQQGNGVVFDVVTRRNGAPVDADNVFFTYNWGSAGWSTPVQWDGSERIPGDNIIGKVGNGHFQCVVNVTSIFGLLMARFYGTGDNYFSELLTVEVTQIPSAPVAC